MTPSPPFALRLGAVGDLHHTTGDASGLSYHGPFDVPGVLRRLEAALRWFADERADALLLAGDLTQFGDAESLARVLRLVAERWTRPAFVVAGNHDVLVNSDALAEALRTVAARHVVQPHPSGVSLGGVRIAGLEPEPPRWADAIASWGHDPVVLVSHWPLVSRARAFAEHGLRYAGDRPGHGPAPHALAARDAPTIVVNGHLHARDCHRAGAVVQLSLGALVESPYEASIVDVAGRDATSTVVRRRARAFGPCDVEGPPAIAPADQTITLAAAGQPRP